MALKKPQFEQEPTTNAAAEEGGDTAVLEREAPVEREERAAQAARPAKQAEAPESVAASEKATAQEERNAPAGTALVKAATTAVGAVNDAAAKAKAFQKEVDAMKGASDFSYGNYRVFKGNNGTIAETGGEEADLGRWAQVRMISWDDHFEISPGEQSASTKDFVAYSKDGKIIDSVIGEDLKSWIGKSVPDYVNYLQEEEEFKNAKARRFVDVGGALLACENGDDAPLGTVVQITLSESSIPAFSRYQQELNDKARCVSMGIPGFALPEDPYTLFFIRELASKGNNKWTKLRISGALPAKL